MPKEEPFRTPCVCGKPVTVTAKGTPRAHVCNAEGGPAWPDDVSPTPEQPIVPADVDETDPEHVCTYAPTGRGTENRCACGKPVSDGPVAVPPPGKVTDDQWRMSWTRDTGFRFKVNKDASFRADCGHMVQTHAPYRERPEGGFECRGEWTLTADAPVPSCMLGRPDTLDRAPADVEETEHVHRFEYGDDGIHQAGSFCDCGAEEPEETDSPTEELLAAIDDPADIADDRELRKGPWVTASFDSTLECGHAVMQGEDIRADGEGGWECEECGDNDEPENWNGTGRPRPSASNVKMPEPEPATDKPRLLDTLREAQASVMGEVPMPTPQGSGPVRVSGGQFTDWMAGQPEPEPATDKPRLLDTLRKGMEFAEAQDAKGMAGHRDPLDDIGAFLSPSQAGIGSGDANDFLSAPEPQALGSATGQPETERDRYGRYLVKDPRTGDYKRSRRGTPEGFTRATTYAKALLDTYGLNQWEKRMVAVGMAKRPDLVQRAKGLDVTADKAALEEIHEAAKEAAGGSEASSAGTEFHTVTEHLDAGLLTPNTVPEEWRTMAKAYAEKMSAAGLTTRTEWIERITFTDRGGEDVTGTADRVLLERDGTPVIGDVKSGKGIDLAEREIAIQLLTYAMGVNQFGLYNKATKQWEPWTGPPVSEEYGIVMHVPVQRPNNRPAYCDLYRVSFRDVQGFDVARAMQAAAWTRRWRNAKGFATPYSPPAAAPRRTWAEAFVSVTTPEEANRLWQAAVDAGMDQGALDVHVQNARAALAALRSQ